MSRAPLLLGFAFTGYRSFGSEKLEAIGPMDAVHLLAGPNNSGKSNVLAIAQRGISALSNNRQFHLENVDRPLGATDDTQRQFTLSVQHSLSIEEFPDLAPDNPLLTKLGEFLAASADIRNGRPGLWINYVLDEQNYLRPSQAQLKKLVEVVQQADALEVVGPLAVAMSGGREGRIPGNARTIWETLQERITPKLPEVRTIGAFRKIGTKIADDQDTFDGPGLIERLAELQNPGFVQPELRERFDRINEFVKALFEDTDARLEVPNTRDTLLVLHQGRWLPIENYGTGLHEVIILAAASTVLSEALVCVEEPEIHLHPTLQRRLLAYLSEETDNQYLIATHSAHMLDSARASLSAVRLSGEQSTVDAAVEPAEVARIGSELGARASDLVQANAVVWVEGPSDRIYIAGWIKALDSGLVQGIHFEVMYYGGSLLRHLAIDDPAVEEFVSLPRINRNFAVVIDSDRTSRYAKICPTKKQVKEAIDASEGTVVWITSGYTVEDYIPPSLLEDAVLKVHPGARCTWRGNKYQGPLDKARIKGRSSEVDKTAVATEVMRHWSSVDAREWPHDLRKRTQELVAMIQAAND